MEIYLKINRGENIENNSYARTCVELSETNKG